MGFPVRTPGRSPLFTKLDEEEVRARGAGTISKGCCAARPQRGPSKILPVDRAGTLTNLRLRFVAQPESVVA
jgi:hypothetical protein